MGFLIIIHICITPGTKLSSSSYSICLPLSKPGGLVVFSHNISVPRINSSISGVSGILQTFKPGLLIVVAGHRAH